MSLIAAAAVEPAFVVPVLLLDISLLALLVVVAFAIVRMRSLFGIVMLQGVYSLVHLFATLLLLIRGLLSQLTRGEI